MTFAIEKKMKYKNRQAAGDLVDHWNHVRIASFFFRFFALLMGRSTFLDRGGWRWCSARRLSV